MKANHTDLQKGLPFLPAELHDWVFCASGSRRGSSSTLVSHEELRKRQRYGLKLLPLAQLGEDAVRETELLRMPLSFSRAEARSAEAMTQQVTIFLPGCSPGFWIKLKNDDLALK